MHVCMCRQQQPVAASAAATFIKCLIPALLQALPSHKVPTNPPLSGPRLHLLSGSHAHVCPVVRALAALRSHPLVNEVAAVRTVVAARQGGQTVLTAALPWLLPLPCRCDPNTHPPPPARARCRGLRSCIDSPFLFPSPPPQDQYPPTHPLHAESGPPPPTPPPPLHTEPPPWPPNPHPPTHPGA